MSGETRDMHQRNCRLKLGVLGAKIEDTLCAYSMNNGPEKSLKSMPLNYHATLQISELFCPKRKRKRKNPPALGMTKAISKRGRGLLQMSP